MEGQNGCNYGANVNIRDSSSHHMHRFFPSQQRTVNQTNFPHLTQWIQTPKTSPPFVEFFAETSNFPPKLSPQDMLENVPVRTFRTVDGVSELHGDISFNHPAASYSSNPTDSYEEQNNTPGKGIQSKPRSSASTRRGHATDRQRKMRIAERIEALRGLLPQSSKENQPSALDDVIDHIKYLQLQIKELSQRKLRGGSSSEPFIFIEGYGHYMSHQQMQDEPLEEMMGKLLEVNPLAAAQLMEGKGLFLMPMDLVEGLC